MYYDMNWQITVGTYQLAILESCEIHKSVDLLADTCTITVPLYANNKPVDAGRGQVVKRGDKVKVLFGYDNLLVVEFEGYLLNIGTDDTSLVLNCEDELFLLRKPVANKQFENTSVKTIAQYLVDQTAAPLTINCSLTIDYDKFVINSATAYDVLKKLQDETKGNIYIKNGVLNIHPPYTEEHGKVAYSFQQNIEGSSLKYKTAEDKQVQIVVENIGADGEKKEVTTGTTGGDKITIKGSGLSESAMKLLADAEYRRQLFDGFEGDITTWLIPYIEPGYSAKIDDEDFEYKNGWYYTKSVTTTFSESGGVRKVQIGIKVSNG
jgi:hypothetical protein